jgi:heme exporter protein A
MSTPVLETDALSRRFGSRWALARVTLRIEPGERFLIVGGNGSGKTTLLRILATALPRSIGGLSVFGLDPERDRAAVRAQLALLSHKSAIYEDLCASENLDIVCRLAGQPLGAEALLAQVGLAPRPDPVRFYSAGMRKRLAFARLVAQKPALALIDEPYGQLDPEGFDLVDGLMDQLAKNGTTVVIASHLVERAAAQCDRALLLEAGQPRFLGPAADVPKAWRVLHRGPGAVGA